MSCMQEEVLRHARSSTRMCKAMRRSCETRWMDGWRHANMHAQAGMQTNFASMHACLRWVRVVLEQIKQRHAQQQLRQSAITWQASSAEDGARHATFPIIFGSSCNPSTAPTLRHSIAPHVPCLPALQCMQGPRWCVSACLVACQQLPGLLWLPYEENAGATES
eukprot:365747-Chlamydomonas_euryale.AAC.10